MTPDERGALVVRIIATALAVAVLLGAIGYLAVLLLLAPRWTREKACRMNMEILGTALGFYALEYNGRLPDSWETLRRSKLIHKQHNEAWLFRCPFDGEREEMDSYDFARGLDLATVRRDDVERGERLLIWHKVRRHATARRFDIAASLEMYDFWRDGHEQSLHPPRSISDAETSPPKGKRD